MMVFFCLFSVAYLLVAAFALVMTYNEQLQTGNHSLALRALSYVACLFWPVTFIVVAVVARTA